MLTTPSPLIEQAILRLYVDLAPQLPVDGCRFDLPAGSSTVRFTVDRGADDAPGDGQRFPSPSCAVDIILTLHEVGHRLTRSALMAALEDSGRRWSESVVGAVLTRLMQAGIVTNRQDKEPKGYGLPE